MVSGVMSNVGDSGRHTVCVVTFPCLDFCVYAVFGSLSFISGCQLSLMVLSSFLIRCSSLKFIGQSEREIGFVVADVSCVKGGEICLCFLLGCSEFGELLRSVDNGSSCCGGFVVAGCEAAFWA